LVSIFVALLVATSAQPQEPNGGYATVTQYSTSSFENGVSGACNCKVGILNYATAALNQFYFGVGPGQGAGPACGKCFKLKIYGDPYDANWCSDAYTLIVKVADLCPAAGNANWCAATPSGPKNFGGAVAHFDIDENHLRPIQQATGRGAFKAKYCQVPCQGNWAGFNDPNANGQQTTAWGSCPKEPNTNIGACTLPTQICSGGGGGGGGSASIVWANGVGGWWVAFGLSANSVSIDCGRGFQSMYKAGWTINGLPVWIWEKMGFMCSKQVTIQYDGNRITTTRPG